MFPQSHPVAKLKKVISAAPIGSSNLVFNKTRLQDIFKNDMYYLDGGQIEEQTKLILDLGVKIGFIQEETTPGEYKITSRARQPNNLESDLIEKWIRLKIEEEKEQEIGKRMEAIKQDLIQEGKKAWRTLGQY